MNDREEELAAQVSALQSAVNGLTEELVDVKARLRELEEREPAEVERSRVTPADAAADPDGPAGTDAGAEPQSPDGTAAGAAGERDAGTARDGTDADGTAGGDAGGLNRDGDTEAEEDEDIIVA